MEHTAWVEPVPPETDADGAHYDPDSADGADGGASGCGVAMVVVKGGLTLPFRAARLLHAYLPRLDMWGNAQTLRRCCKTSPAMSRCAIRAAF